MSTPVYVINLGMGKLSAPRISTLKPPRTSSERFFAANYEHWKEDELTQRLWTFAITTAELNQVGYDENNILPYEYVLPNDCLRPLRLRVNGVKNTWVQEGRTIRSDTEGLNIKYIRNVNEADFDPTFREALAARIAVESAEFLSQSNTKAEKAQAQYDKAIRRASATNAFTRGSEELNDDSNDDDGFSWITDRYN